ncbi:hypothetical protein HK102_011176 [Quaeritorhiza haematococci]|nr:hypothetical protein HK102_011176 [Quaeritorhiza haematococci]
MATDLTDAEIVLGKLGAGLIPVVGLVLCVLPVMMLASLLGGIDPSLLIGSFFVTLGTAVLVCTLAFTLSIGGGKTHEVVGATYLILIAWLALTPLVAGFLLAAASSLAPSQASPGFVEWAVQSAVAANPYQLCFPSFNEPIEEYAMRVAGFLGVCGALSTAMVVACIATIRPFTLRGQVKSGRRTQTGRIRWPRLLPRPSLDSNPVLWREWSRDAPSRWGRFVRGGYALIAILFTVASIGQTGSLLEFGLGANLFVIVVGLLLLSVRASTSLSEERIRGSLDVLLTTPITTPEIVAGKWWGVFRSTGVVFYLPIAAGFLRCLQYGRWVNLALFFALLATYAAIVTSVGLAIAVWVSRQGRAAGLCVGAYVAACFGWPILSVMTAQGENSIGPVLLLGSPMAGAVMGSLAVAEGTPEIFFTRSLSQQMALCSLIQGLAALAIYATACGSFDRKLGRSTVGSQGSVLLALIPRFGRAR